MSYVSHTAGQTRVFDHLYDPTYEASGKKDVFIANTIALAKSAPIQVMANYKNMFSDLQNHPSHLFWKQHNDLPTVPRPDDTTYILDPKCHIPTRKPQGVEGLKRPNYFHHPPSIHSSLNVQLNLPLECPRDIIPRKPTYKNISSQTDYRISSAQTVPYLPDAVCPDDLLEPPELLRIVNLIKNNDPPGDIEARIVERTRKKRKWEMSLPPVDSLDNLDKRREVMDAFEWEQLLGRENELQSCQNERLEMVKELMVEREEMIRCKSAAKLENSIKRIEEVRLHKLEKLQKKHALTMRNLNMVHKNISKKYKSTDVVTEHLDPVSDLYAPQMRFGKHPKRRHFAPFKTTYKARLDAPADEILKASQIYCPVIKYNEMAKPKKRSIEYVRGFYKEDHLKALYESMKELRKETIEIKLPRLPAECVQRTDAIEVLNELPVTPTASVLDGDEKTYYCTHLANILKGRAVQKVIHQGMTQWLDYIERKSKKTERQIMKFLKKFMEGELSKLYEQAIVKELLKKAEEQREREAKQFTYEGFNEICFECNEMSQIEQNTETEEDARKIIFDIIQNIAREEKIESQRAAFEDTHKEKDEDAEDEDEDSDETMTNLLIEYLQLNVVPACYQNQVQEKYIREPETTPNFFRISYDIINELLSQLHPCDTTLCESEYTPSIGSEQLKAEYETILLPDLDSDLFVQDSESSAFTPISTYEDTEYGWLHDIIDDIYEHVWRLVRHRIIDSSDSNSLDSEASQFEDTIYGWFHEIFDEILKNVWNQVEDNDEGDSFDSRVSVFEDTEYGWLDEIFESIYRKVWKEIAQYRKYGPRSSEDESSTDDEKIRAKHKAKENEQVKEIIPHLSSSNDDMFADSDSEDSQESYKMLEHYKELEELSVEEEDSSSDGSTEEDFEIYMQQAKQQSETVTEYEISDEMDVYGIQEMSEVELSMSGEAETTVTPTLEDTSLYDNMEICESEAEENREEEEEEENTEDESCSDEQEIFSDSEEEKRYFDEDDFEIERIALENKENPPIPKDLEVQEIAVEIEESPSEPEDLLVCEEAIEEESLKDIDQYEENTEEQMQCFEEVDDFEKEKNTLGIDEISCVCEESSEELSDRKCFKDVDFYEDERKACEAVTKETNDKIEGKVDCDQYLKPIKPCDCYKHEEYEKEKEGFDHQRLILSEGELVWKSPEVPPED